jgi:hypothetical protein
MADINNIVEELSKLTVLEAAELVKALETKWGVTAAAPVAVAAAAPAAGAAAPAAEAKTTFDVSSRLFVRSRPVSAWLRRRPWLKALPSCCSKVPTRLIPMPPPRRSKRLVVRLS